MSWLEKNYWSNKNEMNQLIPDQLDQLNDFGSCRYKNNFCIIVII